MPLCFTPYFNLRLFVFGLKHMGWFIYIYLYSFLSVYHLGLRLLYLSKLIQEHNQGVKQDFDVGKKKKINAEVHVH